jgi:TIR domain
VPGISRRGVFLSYRRDDAGPYARSLQLQLSQRIPDAPIFMDLDSIEAGLDFAEVIQDAVDSCAVVVVLIGRQWVTLADEDGARRLDNPDDYVRFEVKTALEQGVRVIPVLIDGTKPLRQQDLPAELHKLARLNAHKLSCDRYQDEADRLIDLIQRVLTAIGDQQQANSKAHEEADRKADQGRVLAVAPGAAVVPRATGAHAAEPERKPAKSQQPAAADMIETMLRRPGASRAASPYLRDTVAELQAMGYELSLPRPHPTSGEREKYIKFMDPASPGAAVAYMRPGFLIFSRPSDQGILRRLPGAIVRDKGDVKFAINGQHELEAARNVRP